MAELLKSTIASGDYGTDLTLNTATASDYFTLPYTPDWRANVILVNADTHAATFTLKAGNGHRAAAGDVVYTVPASGTSVISIARAETSRVKVINGTDKGKIFTAAVTNGGTLSLKVAIVVED
jgi:hypothetical protein